MNGILTIVKKTTPRKPPAELAETLKRDFPFRQKHEEKMDLFYVGFIAGMFPTLSYQTLGIRQESNDGESPKRSPKPTPPPPPPKK